MFFSDLEDNANENRFRFGNTTNLNYLNDLQRNHPPATTQYVFGGDAWDFGHSDPTRAKRALSSLYAIQHLQQLDFAPRENMLVVNGVEYKRERIWPVCVTCTFRPTTGHCTTINLVFFVVFFVSSTLPPQPKQHQ